MAISAQQVKELRDMTGAGMADCKKALEESNGDVTGAIEYLRKRGAASAAKRSDKSTNEGLVITQTSADGKSAAIVEINCETDFVARNEEFVQYATHVAGSVLSNPADEAALLATNIGGKTLGDLHNEVLAKFNERIILKRFEFVSTNGFIADYIHTGNKLGVLLEVSNAPTNDTAKGLIRDIAMQVAAMNPTFANREQVDGATLAKERDIYIEQAIQEGKNQQIAERVANGRMEKYYQDFCLVEQTFVKDSGKTINDVLKEISKEIGQPTTVIGFRRYYLGESSKND